MTETKLLPCPFCGKEPKLKKTKHTEPDIFYWVGCYNSGCIALPVVMSWETRAEAIAAWNKRV